MLVYPETPENPSCVVLFIPVELVPIVGSLFSQLESRRKWASDADWSQGYKVFVDLQDQLMNNCLATLIQEIRDIRGVKPEYVTVPIADRTTDMYHDFNDLIESYNVIIAALCGSGIPTDNILQALRGDTAADGTRNLIEFLT